MINPTSALEQFDRYLRARYPIIAIVSHEENRVMTSIRTVAEARNRSVAEWTYTQGLKNLPGVDPDNTIDPLAALEAILQYKPDADPVLFVLKDLHQILSQDIKVIRYLRDIAARFESCRHTLVLLSPTISIPGDLEKTVVMIDWPLPDPKELDGILARCEEDVPSRIQVELGNGHREKVIAAMRGLTAFEAGSVLLSAIAATGELSENCIPYIIREKQQIIRKSGVLEFYDSDTTMHQVGGLPHLKAYAEIKRAAFGDKARAAGVDAPNGLLMVGIPGTGKSLAAKAIAGGQMPLLRMDVGSLMGGLVGQSEANMRAALKVAEAVAPCVLWIDEIEKALGGVSGGEQDGGTTKRVFGTLLTWMQEKTEPVYVIATANDVRSLNAELLRAGRFDDIFWVDLPNLADRMQILSVHLAKRKQVIGRFDLEVVGKASWGFTGAELEKVVKVGVETAFFQQQPLATEHLVEAARRVVPICQTMGEKIADLRNWAQGRALPASEPLEPKPEQARVSNRADDL